LSHPGTREATHSNASEAAVDTPRSDMTRNFGDREDLGALGLIEQQLTKEDPTLVEQYSRWQVMPETASSGDTDVPARTGLLLLSGIVLWMTGPVFGVLIIVLAAVMFLLRDPDDRRLR
jgi:Protein of unknown function (DUF3040)